jgi:DNA-binding NtrC family response regulator
LIKQALERAAGNRTEAARLLGISRNGLANKMQRLGIDD